MIGPNQEKWLEALESGTYHQGRRKLRNADNQFCCLGVAAELFKQHEPPLIDAKYYVYDGRSGTAPDYVIDALALHGEMGDCEEVDFGGKNFFTLASANDAGVSFKEIAQQIRQAPHKFFKEPK